jgi:hypothetical protein
MSAMRGTRKLCASLLRLMRVPRRVAIETNSGDGRRHESAPGSALGTNPSRFRAQLSSRATCPPAPVSGEPSTATPRALFIRSIPPMPINPELAISPFTLHTSGAPPLVSSQKKAGAPPDIETLSPNAVREQPITLHIFTRFLQTPDSSLRTPHPLEPSQENRVHPHFFPFPGSSKHTGRYHSHARVCGPVCRGGGGGRAGSAITRWAACR